MIVKQINFAELLTDIRVKADAIKAMSPEDRAKQADETAKIVKQLRNLKIIKNSA